MIVVFQDEQNKIAHDQFQNWRRRNRDGFFINCKSKSDLILHHVACRHPGDMTWSVEDGYNSLTKKKKICSSDKTELERWAAQNSTARLKYCRDCDAY